MTKKTKKHKDESVCEMFDSLSSKLNLRKSDDWGTKIGHTVITLTIKMIQQRHLSDNTTQAHVTKNDKYRHNITLRTMTRE